MRVIIDRLEEKFAVVETETGVMVDLPRILVPEAKEGDVVNITVDASATDKRKQAIDELMNDLFAD